MSRRRHDAGCAARHRTGFVLGLVATFGLPSTSRAQHEHDAAGPDSAAVSPYVELLRREIKALDPAEIEELLAGEGMELALAAELNGLPGPKHALELAGPLELTPDQRARTEAIFGAMREEAIALGRAIVSAERELDRALAARALEPEGLGRRVEEIGTLRGRLRAAHLAAHLR
ncbi:MAG: hypothetical protein ACRELC_11220, partial [Gemmatimonadota bacterium]